jgi:hypothetical protein
MKDQIEALIKAGWIPMYVFSEDSGYLKGLIPPTQT